LLERSLYHVSRFSLSEEWNDIIKSMYDNRYTDAVIIP